MEIFRTPLTTFYAVSRILSKKHFKSFTQPNQDNEPIDESIAEALTLAKEELGR